MTEQVEALLLSCQLPPVSDAERARIDQAWSEMKATAEAAAQSPAPELEVRLKCTYCQDVLTQETAVYCAACLAPHHRDCFVNHAQCAAPGCAGTLIVEPTKPTPTRPGKRWRPWLFLGSRAAHGGGYSTRTTLGVLVAATLLIGGLIGGILKFADPEDEPWRVAPPGSDPIVVARGQTVRFVEPWSEKDPPDGIKYTSLNGAANIISRDAIAEVEWAVPHLKGQAIFLVTGLQEGSTQFTLRFDRSRRIKQFEVLVEGDDGHAIARDAALAKLRLEPMRRVAKVQTDAKTTGDTFTKRRDFPGKESYYRQALLQYEVAVDASRTLLAKGGARYESQVRASEDAEAKARQDYEDFVDRELAIYRDAVARGEPRPERVSQLKRVLGAINHECDPRYMRLKLILNEAYDAWLETDGSEECAVVHAPGRDPVPPPAPAPEKPFDPRTFDHDRTAFPLVGAHEQADCAACHAGGVTTEEQPHGKPVVALLGDAPDVSCASCHRSPHELGQRAQACAACHSANETWNSLTMLPGLPGGSLQVVLRNGLRKDGSLNPRGSFFSAQGSTPGYPDGTRLHVTLSARGRSRDFPVKILQAVVKSNAYDVSFPWQGRTFAPLLYRVEVELNLRKQPRQIQEWFATEYGYGRTHTHVVDDEYVALGDEAARLQFARTNFARIKGFVKQLDSLRKHLIVVTATQASETASWQGEYLTFQQSILAYRGQVDGHFRQYILLLEQGLYKRLLDHMRNLDRIVRDHHRGREGVSTVERLKELGAELDATTKLIEEHDPDEAQIPLLPEERAEGDGESQ